MKDPWEASKIDYDRSIHSNRDAKAWADFFVATYPGLADKHDIMLGWFANAMMAMHDSLKREARAMVVPALTDEDLNRYSMDCDERDAVEFGYNLAASRIMPAGRVTIPPLTGGEIEARLLRLFPGIGEDDPLRESCFKDSRWAYNLAVSRARAIPADRVLGEGMVAVDLAELEALREFHDAYTEDGECDLEEFLQKMNSISGKITALRANQGGAAR